MELSRGYRNSDPSPLPQLAERQHGVVSWWQLERLGYPRWSVSRLVKLGLLHRLARGVYAVGHTRLTARGRWMAAVLACGPGAVLSHQAAAALWELRSVPSGRIDVTATGKHTVRGVRCHVARRLPRPDRMVIDGIPVTSLHRTLLDLTPRLSDQRLRSYLEAVQGRDLLDLRSLDALLARSAGRAGTRRLRDGAAALAEEPPWTQSKGERRLLELVRAAGLPEPACNVYVEDELVDFLWRPQRLVVEIDHYGTHGSRRSFEEDRRRDIRLQRAGFRVVRITYEQLRRNPAEVIGDITALLAAPVAIG
jgi:very-short-patch-repair endonuclease